MEEKRKISAKVFRIVSLGEEILPTDIHKILVNAITLDPKKPDTFFTVVDCTEEITNPTDPESRVFLTS